MNTKKWFSVLCTGLMAMLWLGMTPLQKLEPGAKVPAFALKDINGGEHALKEFLGNKLVVVMFIATQCPVSNAYNERMEQLAKDYTSKSVAFIGINSNKQEDVQEVRDHAKAHGFTFTVLKDPQNQVADAYAAQVTPEIFVVDSQGILRYHGRIDDGRDESDVTSRDLRNALDALLAQKDVARAETKAFGCSIKRVQR
jgi:peroxiredoxin